MFRIVTPGLTRNPGKPRYNPSTAFFRRLW